MLMVLSVGFLLIKSLPSDAHDALYWSSCWSKAFLLMLMMLCIGFLLLRQFPF